MSYDDFAGRRDELESAHLTVMERELLLKFLLTLPSATLRTVAADYVLLKQNNKLGKVSRSAGMPPGIYITVHRIERRSESGHRGGCES